MANWQALLDYWFAYNQIGRGASASAIAALRNSLWFGKTDAQDEDVRQRYGTQLEAALNGQIPEPDDARVWLAQLIMLDQLPRMIHRDTPRAFSGDPLAQALLARGMARGFDRQLSLIERVFAYLVLEHAEDIDLQNQALDCFGQLLTQAPRDERPLFAGFLDFARRHQVIIERFARFPHRNAILGRASSPAEQAFLQEPGSSF